MDSLHAECAWLVLMQQYFPRKKTHFAIQQKFDLYGERLLEVELDVAKYLGKCSRSRITYTFNHLNINIVDERHLLAA